MRPRPERAKLSATRGATAPSGHRNPGAALRFVATIGSPLAIATALLFYFGWVRATVQARELGYDTSITGLSTTDYVLRSVNVLYLPVLLLLFLALFLHGGHARLMAAANQRGARGRATLMKTARLLQRSWLGWIPLGVALYLTPATRSIALPGTITIALLSALYAQAILEHVHAGSAWPTARRALVLVLLALVCFWDTERVARKMGEEFAADIVARPGQLPAVTVYSEKSLRLATPGVVETELNSTNSAYAYKYTGLHLLEGSTSTYFLLSKSPAREDFRVIVLNKVEGFLIEFAPGSMPRSIS